MLIEVLSGQPDAALVRARAALEACRIGRLRQHLLSMVCALAANRNAHRDLAHRAARLARNARETYDVRHQASAVLHVLGLAEPDEIARLDQAVVLDPLVLQTLSTASDDRSKAWHAAMTARLER